VGEYWEGCRFETKPVRSKMSLYALGVADHREAMQNTIKTICVLSSKARPRGRNTISVGMPSPALLSIRPEEGVN